MPEDIINAVAGIFVACVLGAVAVWLLTRVRQ